MSAEGSAKRQKSEVVEVVTEEIDPNLKNLMEVQEKIDKIGEECAIEIVEIEKKYNIKKRPFFEERNKFIKTVENFWATVVCFRSITLF
jgi:hypothetical protein